jgi:hypothetical protein
MKSLSISFVLLILFSCSKTESLKQTFEQAGENRFELQKVLEHYRQEPLKLKAAEFLIAYMGYNKFSFEGEIIASYDTLFAIYDSLYRKGVFVGDPPVIRQTWENLIKEYGRINRSLLSKIDDSRNINSGFLIGNIDVAFAAWEKSFLYKPENFDLFCEYILPYRIQHEPVEEYRQRYYKEFKPILDTVTSVKGLIQAFHLELYWNQNYRTSQLLWDYPLELPASQIERGHRGSCRQLAPWQALVMRACGYLVAVDRAVWANRNQGHLWNVLLLDSGKIYPFDALEDTIRFAYKPAKIFRKTYSYDIRPFENLNREDVPLSFFCFDEKDVTHEYVTTSDIAVPIRFVPEKYKKKKQAIICTFDNNAWKPVYWGEIQSGKIHFKNIAVDIAYIAAYYDKGEIIPATEPFLLHPDGRIQECKADTNKRITLHLERKFPRFARIEDFAWGLRRTNAEAANNPQFKDCVKFFSIYDIPFQVTDSLVNDPHKYRYVRFNSSTLRNAHFAEVEFYGKKHPDAPEEKLSGKIIGYPPIQKDNEHPYTHAMDGDLETWFGKPKNEEGWVGLDLGKRNERIITRVRFCPRSDTNFILEGDTYELMFWDNNQWNSMGKKVALQYNFIDYEDVPSGTIYLLHNLSRGKEERIFTYEDGKQVWW